MNTTSFLSRAKNALAVYADRVNAFSRNSRLYLASVVFLGAAIGVYRLLFNFYVLSLGYNEALLGTLVTTSSLTALIAAMPLGYLIDIIGQKRAFIYGAGAMIVSIVVMVLFPSGGMFVAMSILLGLGQSLNGVAMGPFLMENSGEKERTYLFSFSSGLMMASAFVGNWIGGYLPTWMAGVFDASPTSPIAYGWSLGAIAVLALSGLIPLFFLRPVKLEHGQRSMFAPLSFFAKNTRLLTRLILPMLVTSLGAGLIMPFLNVFYRQVHNQPDPVIGAMFAWGSLAMGIGLLVAPPLADRFGKIQVVVVTQALSIPFLFMMGFSPFYALSAAAYYIRLTFMNMSGPVYQTFVMEKVDPSARATVASLVSMSNSVGWAFSPQISGWLQVKYGFDPAYAATIVLYVISIYLYWRYFWYPDRQKKVQPFPQESI